MKIKILIMTITVMMITAIDSDDDSTKSFMHHIISIMKLYEHCVNSNDALCMKCLRCTNVLTYIHVCK